MRKEIVKVNKKSYGKYEELLLLRDALKKEALSWKKEYNLVFGKLIIAVLSEEICCVQRKKAIEFCQIALNQGRAVSKRKLNSYVEKESRELQRNLDAMIEEHKAAKGAGDVAERDLLKVKKIYHKLVKQIHPDLNPRLADVGQFQSLWRHVVYAYNENDLKSLQVLQDLVNKAFEQSDLIVEEIKIPRIARRINDLEKEIETIKGTNPYQYRFLLNDPVAVAQKKKQLKKNLKEYKEHANRLNRILERMLESRVPIVWETTDVFNGGAVGVVEIDNLAEIVKPLVREIWLFDSHVAGTTHLDDQSVLETIAVGDVLILRREDNRHDSNAILVLNRQKQKLGYVPQRDNAVFARLMDAGKLLQAKVAEIEHRKNYTLVKIGVYLINL